MNCLNHVNSKQSQKTCSRTVVYTVHRVEHKININSFDQWMHKRICICFAHQSLFVILFFFFNHRSHFMNLVNRHSNRFNLVSDLLKRLHIGFKWAISVASLKFHFDFVLFKCFPFRMSWIIFWRNKSSLLI